ncbi:Protein YIPF [Entamoeba marina]
MTSQNPFLNEDESQSGFIVNDEAVPQPDTVNFSSQEQINFGGNTGADEERPTEEKKEYHWYHFYKAEYYEQFFNIEINDVLKRMLWGLCPFFGNFFTQTEENPDLFGPIWIPFTVIFLAFFSGSLSSLIRDVYDYQKLSIISGTVLAYIIFVPLVLWVVCRFVFHVKASFTQYYCLFGYAYTVYLIAIPLCAIPYWYVQIPIILIGTFFMCLTVFKNLFQLLYENTKLLYLCITLGSSISY